MEQTPTWRDLNAHAEAERAARHELGNRFAEVMGHMEIDFGKRLRDVEKYQDRQAGGVRAMAVLATVLGVVSAFASFVALIKS